MHFLNVNSIYINYIYVKNIIFDSMYSMTNNLNDTGIENCASIFEEKLYNK